MNKITSTDWKKIRVGDVCEIGRGSSPRPIADPQYFEGGTIPWIKIADATRAGKYLYDTKEKVNEYGASFSRLMPRGTLIVAASGTLGYTQFLGVPGCIHDGWLYLSNFKGVDEHFLYYHFKWRKQHFYNMAYGAAIQNINTTILREMEIDLPPFPIQRKIAAILSAYDDLIENNMRRIKILEEMAQAIYREWFVHFRFPGHEKVKMVNSPLGKIPEGWEVTNLGEQLVALESGKRPKGGVREVADGVPSIGAENINGIGCHDFANERFIPRKFFEQMRKGVVRDRDVAIYKDGAHIGRSSYFRDGFPHSECCVNEHVFLLRTTGARLTQNALYLWLQQAANVQAIRATNANAAQPGINQRSVSGLELVVPDSDTAKAFDRLVEPMMAEIVNHAKRNETLRRIRDLLLPKLISGEIDVEKTKTIEGENN